MILQFGQVERIMQVRHTIAEPSYLAFRARLQHFQKLKFPDGINTGKGRPAQYGWDQLFQLAFALDLVEVGLAPDVSANLVRNNAPSFLGAIASWNPGLLLIRLSSLAHMKVEGLTEFAHVWDLNRETVIDTLTNSERGVGRPSIVVNPQAMAEFMVGQVATCTGQAAEVTRAEFEDWKSNFPKNNARHP